MCHHPPAAKPPSASLRPRLSLLCVAASMGAIGHVQYTWTLFVPSLAASLAASLPQVQLGFSLFVGLQTSSVLCLGLLVHRSHHRLAMCAGSLVVGLSLCGLAAVRSLTQLYACCALLGLGVGCVYNGCMSLSVRLFPLQRGLAAGVSAAAYGGGTVLTVAYIEAAIEERGSAYTLRALGLSLAAVTLAASSALPAAHWRGAAHEAVARHADEPDVPLSEAVRGCAFWVLYLMLVLITFTGLVVSAQLRPIADAFGMPSATLVLALQADRILTLISRPFWGALSDCIGRAQTLALAFGLQALVLLTWAARLSDASFFVVCSALSTFSWGEVYSMFPAIAADLYGVDSVSATFGALYTGKAVASVLAGPVASFVAEQLSWSAVILLMALVSFADALLAALSLGPLIRREAARRCSTLS
ncbi:hypothetical protein AB1Y20_013504 [Prymnesium parvum]|uniref:Major facilitator superfamily (MFS) profile domain-containing protein n=1 Tax=Prymnesium parvum TaxID=97485 RepID=A0AB34IFP1_PRYPA